MTEHINGTQAFLNPLLQNKALSSDAVGQKTAMASADAPAGNMLDAFGDLIKTQMETINQLEGEANDAKVTYASGGDIELHSVILSAERADLSLNLAMQVRNKIIDAYQVFERMSV
ncbi:MAG: flagellar hook-basal body complex protein FliE [Cyanobacteria bacterium P01_H01_bin.74]